MAMDKVTQLSDLMNPTVFADWVKRSSTETDRFLRSGILTPDQYLGSRLLQPGLGITIPTLNDLGGDTQAWNDNTDITTEGIGSDKEQEVKFADAKAYAVTDYSQLISGAPVMEQYAGQFGNWWARLDEKRLIKLVQTAFNNDDIKTAKSYNIGSEKDLNPGDFIAAISRMGDVVQNNLSQIVVNSAAYGQMRKQNLIETIQPSNGGVPFEAYNGMRIVLDDSIPLDDKGTTVAYIFGNGAVQYSTATPANGNVITRDEFKNGGEQAIIQKRLATMHISGTTLDMTQLSNGFTGFRDDLLSGNKKLYKVADDPRSIQLVEYGFKVDPEFVVKGINTKKDDSKSTSTPDSKSTSGSSK
ncbi:phage-related minor capsid protein (gpg protein) [Fructilactobacillus fructivorans]|uniref:hypothetical protein n=1 Tax=Fructilactobacillus fructivorans TaxID=1614 RepID=UPI000704916A|nr:hypothetical protein [Fructilactobacillus fructivorans]KRN13459.1 phage-related minor capsid protein (gpg protein) [Fructilactobacillus fructivorans]